MRKSSEKKLVAAKTRRPRVKKDMAFADKRTKTGRKRNISKKGTAVSPNGPEVSSSIAQLNKKTVEVIDTQKLFTAGPDERANAQLKNQTETILMRPEESFEKAAAKIEQQVRGYVETITGLEIALLKEKTDRIAAEEKARMYAQQLAQLQEKLKTPIESQEKNGVCNCCGRTDVSEENLVKIDSGQRMCPACLAELMSLLPNDPTAN